MKFHANRHPFLVALWMGVVVTLASAGKKEYFERISTFLICEQEDPTCNTDVATNAEIVTSFSDGDMTCLVYSDSEQERLGFVDITDPSKPTAAGTVDLGGEPTTVKVIGDYAVVGVNTSPDYVNPSGHLAVIDLASMAIVQEIELPGQPDAVDVSPKDSDFPMYIGVAIENERDEDLGDGAPPQLPAGAVTIIDIADASSLADPSTWTTRDIDMTGLDGCLYPTDPEPEYLEINSANTLAVVTMQENNCNAIIELSTGTVTSFDAGAVPLQCIDMTEDDVILQIEDTEPEGLLREPDGATWIGETGCYATANEGDLDGGSRGFTIFDSVTGDVIYDSGNTMEIEIARIGHYPENRSENKGNEPENLLYAEVDGYKFLFVVSERSSVVVVYDVEDPSSPVMKQILPAGVGPEGLTVIPEMNLLAVASEVDERENKIRSSISLYELTKTKKPSYPTIVSEERDGIDGYIPFSALSGLAACEDPHVLYAIEDSFYIKSRIFTIDVKSSPAVITKEARIMDTDGVLAACLDGKLGADDEGEAITLADMINDDMTVNIDPEGIAISSKGGWWVASEGRGTVGDAEKPYEYPNMLLKVTMDAVIEECILLDDSFPDQVRFGFEGVAEEGDMVVVTLQRAWGDEANPRIAVYNTTDSTWKHAFYPLAEPTSQNGGWVGLSDIAPAGDGKFYVLERDNQGGPDAGLKCITCIDLGDFSFEDGVTLEKELYRDLMADYAETGGMVPEKVKGLAIASNRKVWIVNDNDGVDDNSGEQQLLNVAKLPKSSKKNKSKADKSSKSKASKSSKSKADKKDKKSKK